MKIDFNGEIIEIEKPIFLLDLVREKFESQYLSIVAAKIDGKLSELMVEIDRDCKIETVSVDSKEGKEVFWHSSSHVLAIAVKRVFPDAKLAIGPSIAEGFYYDFGVEKPFSEDDIKKIEKEVKKVVKEGIRFEKVEYKREELLDIYRQNGEKYKIEIIENDITDETISVYKNGDFFDMCRGPHVPSTRYIKAFKILSTSGAYWRGNEQNDMLQRIYGISFENKDKLKEFLFLKEEAKKRNHKKLGKELEFFTFYPEAPGEAFWFNKGVILRNQLIDFMREIHEENDYEEIITPLILKRHLWETSGHWANYKDNMYTTVIEDEDYAIKPMNCPGGMLMYKDRKVSYRELPKRMAEFGLVHRYERSGALNGLFRVRAFTQDDAHVFMTPEQLKDEIINIVQIIDKIYKETFGFNVQIELSTRPDKYIGEIEQWNSSEKSLQDALEEMGKDFTINEGDGAFYGPKIDFHLEDSMKRTHQCATIQVDMNLPERFDLSYEGSDGNRHRPVVIHRALYGSIERFIGILIEHFAGVLPLWLAPVGVMLIPVSDKFLDETKKLKLQMKKAGIRVDIDTRNERVGYKIREAEVKKYPYMLVVGEKEIENNSFTLRKHGKGDMDSMNFEEMVRYLKNEIDNKNY